MSFCKNNQTQKDAKQTLTQRIYHQFIELKLSLKCQRKLQQQEIFIKKGEKYKITQ